MTKTYNNPKRIMKKVILGFVIFVLSGATLTVHLNSYLLNKTIGVLAVIMISYITGSFFEWAYELISSFKYNK